MADGVDVTFDGFDQLLVAFDRAPVAAAKNIHTAVRVNAHHIRDTWRDKVRGNPYAPRAPYSISYEDISKNDDISFEIGPVKGTGRQGGVVLLLEIGAPAKNLAPRGYGAASLAENVEDLVDGIDEALKGIL